MLNQFEGVLFNSLTFTCMKDFFKDKVVIVTGASSGIGASLVREFLNRGSKVVMAARDEARMLESTKAYYEQG